MMVDHVFFTPLFSRHSYFGLDPNQVIFFSQGTLPCIDNDGHIMLASRSSIATAPDGNGGMFMALYKSPVTINGKETTSMSIVDHMVEHGIKSIHIVGVDNAIVRVCIPAVSHTGP